MPSLPAISVSLFEPRHDGVLLSAISWIEALLLGSFATIIAVIAIAILGFMMLRGQLLLRHGARVLLGCFILFGAGAIASGIRSLADEAPNVRSLPQVAVQQPVEPLPPAPDFDPYAGASVPRN